jgi:SAM-dependent methyltransferase
MDILSDLIGSRLREGSDVLDVGCGDGKIDYLIMQKRNVEIHGVDVLVREKTYIPVDKYDGIRLPSENGAFDAVVFIDALHHTNDPIPVLKEAMRAVSGDGDIIIKDHLLEGLFAKTTLKFMDYFGNAHYGVSLPYNYLSKRDWDACFAELGLNVTEFTVKLHLYPFPFDFIFGRKLHFIAKLSVS